MSRSGRMSLALLAMVLWAGGSDAAPTVSMTAPANSALYLAPGTLPVKANASVGGGATITRVEFYANGVLINTDYASPFQFDWSGVAAGTYSLNAVAYDSTGAQTASAARTITVSGSNTPPTVSLSAPADNARYLNPSSVTLSATAAGPELNDILQKVDFFLNGTLAGTVTAAPYTFPWTSPALGTYTLTAVATDSQGAQTTSSPRTVVITDQNQAPAVSIVTPLDNSKWHSPAGFMFQANASSGEANDIVRVDFYVNGVLQGQDTTAPYSVNLSNLTAGAYTLMARAIDGQNAQTDSVTRTITVSDTNLAPTVTISAPAANANFPTAPAGVTLSANASAGEVNGWITRVDFYVNGSLVNTDTSGPWSFSVSGLANGIYTLTDKAVDQLNGETTSAPIAITVGPQPKLHFIHVDHINTPRLVSNDLQQVVWRWDQQEPFGINVPDENPLGLGVFDFPMRLPGQYADKETSLYYNYFRDYDPHLGAYKQSDPIGLRGGVNTYAYVEGGPLHRVDPLGLCDPDDLICQAAVGQTQIPAARSPCDQRCFESFFGIATVVASGVALSGTPTVPKTFATPGSSPATSVASQTASKVFGQAQLPVRMPAPTAANPGAMTRSVARFAGRWIPIGGFGMLIYDFYGLIKCLNQCNPMFCNDTN
jgi:RHS repeat-associated protein